MSKFWTVRFLPNLDHVACRSAEQDCRTLLNDPTLLSWAWGGNKGSCVCCKSQHDDSISWPLLPPQGTLFPWPTDCAPPRGELARNEFGQSLKFVPRWLEAEHIDSRRHVQLISDHYFPLRQSKCLTIVQNLAMSVCRLRSSPGGHWLESH